MPACVAIGFRICVLLSWLLPIAALQANPIILGNDVSAGAASLDSWTVLVVNETDTFSNTTGAELQVGVTNFSCYIGNARGQVTPFVVRVNGNNNFTVIAIGDSRQSGVDYSSVGMHAFRFTDVDPQPILTLQPGETIAAGFLDSFADGSVYAGSMIPFNGGGDEIWYTGGPNLASDGGSVVLNAPPVSGAQQLDLNRNYKFQVQITTTPIEPEPPTDIRLDPQETFPGMPPGSIVGTLTAVDANPQDTHTFALVPGAGDTDNGRFGILGDQLQTTAPIGTPGTVYSIRVRATDSSGPPGMTFEKSIAINVVADQAPTDIAFSTPFIARAFPPGLAIGVFTTSDPNPNDAHAYSLVAGTGDTHNGLFEVLNNQLLLTQAVPGEAALSFRVQSTDLSGLTTQKTFVLTVIDTLFRLNEVAASNGTFEDEDQETPDWIEIKNLTGSSQSIGGYYLTDDPDNLTQWQFPEVSVPANGFLVVFASSKNRTPTDGSPLHASFRMNAGGEYLALVMADGVTIVDEFNPEFPQQEPGVTYGYNDAGTGRGYLHPPTPNAPNPATVFSQGRNAVSFDPPRGSYSNSFSLTLTSSVPGSVIRYTTDGSSPTPVTGSIYNGPITITPDLAGTIRGTKRIRAIATHPEAPPGVVATHTYVFISGITGNPAADGVVGQSVLSTAITQHAAYRDRLADSFSALPVVSIVKVGGVTETEQETSIEFFDPTGAEPGFAVSCGIKAVGGHSVGSPKDNFRLIFRSAYGTSRLRYPLFEGHPHSPGAATRFQQLQLRSGSHDNFFWLAIPGNPPVPNRHGDAQYLRNRWINDMHFQLGKPALHGRFVHVYLNGTYHGQYHFIERPTEHWHASYFGGQDEDWHFNNGANPAKDGSDHGNGDTWQAAWGSLKASLGNYALARQWVDIENLADYMILNFYAGNTWDWNPNQNWMSGGPGVPGAGGWRFYCWDADIILQDVSNNNLGKNVPDGVFQTLMGHDDFRVYFRDRIYKHLFNDGILTPERIIQTYAANAGQIYRSLIAETARWQPAAAHNPPWDRDGEWLTEMRYLTNVFFHQRGDILMQQFRGAGWYPVEAPAFSQFGGLIEPGFLLDITHPNGAGSTLYVTVDGTDPRLPGGALSPSAQVYNGPIILSDNVHVRARVKLGDNWSAQAEATFTTGRFHENLVITEIHYHPPGQFLLDGGAFEFLELKNTGPVTLDLSGIYFSRGITFAFTNGTSLGPGQHFVLVSDANAFAMRHPGVAHNGVYSGNLNNGGETLEFSHTLLGRLYSVTYADQPPWPVTPDGLGFSLVPRHPNGSPDPDHHATWRASAASGGSPGIDDPDAAFPLVVINEIAPRPASGSPWIELRNLDANPADVSGWFLSDSSIDARQFRIPDGTVVDSGGRLQLGPSGLDEVGQAGTTFPLHPFGDEIYLFSGDATTNLTGYSHGFDYGAAATDTTFGRYERSDGEVTYPAQQAATPGAANAGPAVGPVVLEEIHYHPAFGEPEFLQLINISAGPVSLFEAANPINTWRINGLAFSFPDGITLSAGERIIVTAMGPLQFRARYAVPDATRVLGPYFGNLQDSGERLRLQMPETTPTNGVAYISVDTVRYNDKIPWPTAADGSGASLQRVDITAYGNDPVNWTAALPSPGQPLPTGSLPVITLQPRDQSIVAYQDAAFSAVVSGPGPIHLQWRFEGTPLVGATNSTLTVTNVQTADAGAYDLVAYNASGNTISTPAVLSVLIPATIITQPEDLIVDEGGTATFTVAATSSTPMTFQWRFNGSPIPDATTASLTLNNARGSDDGFYDVIVTDGVGPVASRLAKLTVRVVPRAINLATNYTVVAGGTLTLSVETIGTTPMSYRWRRSFFTVRSEIRDDNVAFLTLTNVQESIAGPANPYTVVLTNAASFTPGELTPPFFITILADTDTDGLPDVWETAHNHDPADPSDANTDQDNDGLTAAEEYMAGTDPDDDQSFLKIEAVEAGQPTVIRFRGKAAKTYTVEYTDDLTLGIWSQLTEMQTGPTDRLMQATDPAGIGQRFYRIRTPAGSE